LLQATLLNRLKYFGYAKMGSNVVNRAGLVGTKKLTLQEFRDILKTQIELMLKEADNYKEISSKTVFL